MASSCDISVPIKAYIRFRHIGSDNGLSHIHMRTYQPQLHRYFSRTLDNFFLVLSYLESMHDFAICHADKWQRYCEPQNARHSTPAYIMPQVVGTWKRRCAYSWWRHQMEIFSALLAFCVCHSPMTGEFPSQRPVTRSFDVFFDLRLNRQLSKQWRRWWFATLPRSLWCHSNVLWGRVPFSTSRHDQHVRNLADNIYKCIHLKK